MNTSPLKIAVLGAQTPFKELLLQFVERNYQAGVLVDAAQADVCIIDLDGSGSENLLQDQRQCRPDQTVIVLALNDPAREDCLWLKKPLQTSLLTLTLEKIRNPHLSQKDLKIVVAGNQGSPLYQAAQVLAVKHEVNKKAVNAVAVSAAKYYDPVEYLQGVLIKAYRQAVTTGITLRIETGWEPIFIYPHQRKVWVEADDKKLQAFCHLSIRKFAQLTGELASGPGITPDPTADVNGPPDSSQTMESFLWKVSWWNSAGRLPRNVRSSHPVRLKRWPNLTRLWCPANSLRIASFLYQYTTTPQAAVSSLGLPAADVFSFISAARAIGLIERIEEKPDTQPITGPERHSGLLSRILQRLRR